MREGFDCQLSCGFNGASTEEAARSIAIAFFASWDSPLATTNPAVPPTAAATAVVATAVVATAVVATAVVATAPVVPDSAVAPDKAAAETVRVGGEAKVVDRSPVAAVAAVGGHRLLLDDGPSIPRHLVSPQRLCSQLRQHRPRL